MSITLHDIYGTPYKFQIKTLQDGEYVEQDILLSPPTIKFYEVLLANYSIELEDTMSLDVDIEDAKAVVNLLSRTLQMLHIAASMVDSTVTFEDVESWFTADNTIIPRYLNSLVQFMPSKDTKQEDNKRKVVNPKVKSQPKQWMPK